MASSPRRSRWAGTGGDVPLSSDAEVVAYDDAIQRASDRPDVTLVDPTQIVCPDRTYRPHLDGIRALAVVAVVAFHLGYDWIPGGFIGVDVFFVLSGYLISGLLLGEATRGDLGLGRFYARRARRLLPASLAVLAAVMWAGWVLFDPVEKESLGRDAIWAALYSANWRFATVGGDHFAPGDVPSPLVHYWSLAVEEQFYLVWPALFLALLRWSTRRRGRDDTRLLIGAVAGLAAVSLWASIAFVGTPLTYYGTQARAYQLLAGALLALVVERRRWRIADTVVGRRSADAVAVVALVVLAALAPGIRDATDYPGWPGLAVTLASVALIVGVDLGPRGATARALGHGSMAAVGRLSYSLYIWHWPIIVLLPLLVAERGWPSWLSGRPGLVAAMVAVAGVSYLVVERPIRFRLGPSVRPGVVVTVGVAASLVTAAVAHQVFLPDDAWEQDALKAVRDLAEPGPCPYFAEDWPAAGDAEPCVYRDGDGPVVAIVGDSHAQQWQPALEELAEESDARIVRATRGGCPANDVVPVARQPDGRIEVDDRCVAWRASVYPQVVALDPDVILVATRSHVRAVRLDGRDVFPDDVAHLPEWTDAWDATLDQLASGGARVVVSAIVPTLPERVPACLIEEGPTAPPRDAATSPWTATRPWAPTTLRSPRWWPRTSASRSSIRRPSPAPTASVRRSTTRASWSTATTTT